MYYLSLLPMKDFIRKENIPDAFSFREATGFSF
ncbi:hypothetical protein [Oceanobacillus iheyensis HTE831]|uniref:Uncharacterized protein n=1 Tax=Oceanobacillus iheyensis (strain DSM 14371 / CIP 107618 / JCM 11309 / KCTC 3954 / HTE831) TaxID=221109 RepID=Q8EMR0_OCEIH|nr:hypothetical protein [Oceanobacillus iheyensis HTE831]